MFTLFTDLSKPINTDDSANNPVTHHYGFFSSHCAIYIFETTRSFLCNELLCLLMPSCASLQNCGWDKDDDFTLNKNTLYGVCHLETFRANFSCFFKKH